MKNKVQEIIDNIKLKCSSCKKEYNPKNIAQTYVCPFCGKLDRTEIPDKLFEN
jgi:predicted RNA-binding Zn-ribbon protein involved in translation (DUF1610 family)